MPDLKKAIEIIFQGNDVSLSRTIKNIERDIGSVDSAFGGLGGHAASLTKDIALLGAATGGMAIAFGAFAANEASDFQTQIQNINTLLSDTAEKDLPAIKAGILELAAESPKSLEDLTAAFYDIQSGTGAGAEGLSTLDAAMKGSVAGMTDVALSASGLVTVLNSYGLEASEAENIMDIMFATVQSGVLTFEDLATNIGKVAFTGNAANQTFATTGAAIATLTAATGQQSESFTKLEQLYNKLSTRKVQEDFKALGITVTDTQGNLLPLADIIGKVSEKQLSYTKIMELLPEKEAAAALSILSTQHDTFTKNLNSTNNALGKTDEAFAKMAETFDNQIKVLSNAWNVFLITVGEPILKELAPIIKDLTDKMKGLESQILAGEIGQAFANWISLLAEFSENVALIYRDITGIQDASILVDFAKWAGDTETIKSALTAVNTIVQGVVLGGALVHDAFAATGNILAGTQNILETALLTPILLVSKATEGWLLLLNSIPGLDLTGPLEAVKATSDDLWKTMQENQISAAPFEFWSDNVAESIAVVDGAIQSIGETSETSAKKTEDAFTDIEIEEGVTKALVAVGDAAVETAEKTETLNSTMQRTADVSSESEVALNKQVQKLADFQIEMEKIASSERVAVFEIQADLQSDKIEANVREIEAMFGSLDNVISTTGDTILGLYALLGESQDWSVQQDIERSIEKQEEMQREAWKKEEELINKKMELMDAQIAIFESNEGIKIEVEAEGLTPALEEIFQEVMNFAQVRMNAQGVQHLLALEVTE